MEVVVPEGPPEDDGAGAVAMAAAAAAAAALAVVVVVVEVEGVTPAVGFGAEPVAG